MRELQSTVRDQFDRLFILRRTGGNQNRAAEVLGLSRITLRTKLRELRIAVEKIVTPTS